VLLILVALLGLLALASNAGSILNGIRDWLVLTFDRAWFVPVCAALGLGAYLLWPKAPRPRAVDLVSGFVAVLALIGIFGLVEHGGSAGLAIDQALFPVVGLWGAWALLVALLVIGLIVTVHFSPGALLATMVGAGQAAYAERLRLQNLVTPPSPGKAKALKPEAATKDELARSAASFATPPPALEPARPWEIDEPVEAKTAMEATKAGARTTDDDPAPAARAGNERRARTFRSQLCHAPSGTGAGQALGNRRTGRSGDGEGSNQSRGEDDGRRPGAGAARGRRA